MIEAHRWIRVSDAAARLLVCSRTVRKWAEKGFLDTMPLNPNAQRSTLLVSLASIERIEQARQSE